MSTPCYNFLMVVLTGGTIMIAPLTSGRCQRNGLGISSAYGSVLSMFCAIAATFVAAFFLYDPIYSLYVEGPREVGELVLFAGTAVIGAKCTAEIARPAVKYRNQAN